MADFATQRAREFYAQTYDAVVSDWPGEIDFYRELAAAADANGGQILEIACGTGRIAIPLALSGFEVVGLDLSPAMLDVARAKSAGLTNVRWVQGDMRGFDLGETFALIIIPGHAFQNLETPADQIACLETLKRHLDPTGVLVIHHDNLDVRWLGDLLRDQGGVFEAEEPFTHPATGRTIRTLQAWSYERTTQTAISETVWEEIDAAGQVTDRWESGPLRFHCPFRYEMEHLLARTGFDVEAVYGNFDREALADDSTEMVWVARSRDRVSASSFQHLATRKRSRCSRLVAI